MKRIVEIAASGVQLIEASQGWLGLELARAHRPDLILLDVHLPDIPGSAVLKHLQEDSRTMAIPVVVVSADATPEQMELLLASGAQSYALKLIDIGSMLRLLDSCTGGWRAGSSAIALDTTRRSAWARGCFRLPAAGCRCFCDSHFPGSRERRRSVQASRKLQKLGSLSDHRRNPHMVFPQKDHALAQR